MGQAAITNTRGNPSCHVILRGGKDGPNYSPAHLDQVKSSLEKSGLKSRIMVDCSHGNSLKNHLNQLIVGDALCEQLVAGNNDIFGVMIESNINAGNQKVPSEGPGALKYGVSITDACIDWESTDVLLRKLSSAQKTRSLNRT